MSMGDPLPVVHAACLHPTRSAAVFLLDNEPDARRRTLHLERVLQRELHRAHGGERQRLGLQHDGPVRATVREEGPLLALQAAAAATGVLQKWRMQ
jgi:hypothetical protein